jgi:hypothetical protein
MGGQDRAARKLLELHQPGDDPAALLVRVRAAQPSGLNSYEQRVFDRVAAVAGSRLTPLEEITRQYADGGPHWFRHLRAEVPSACHFAAAEADVVPN